MPALTFHRLSGIEKSIKKCADGGVVCENGKREKRKKRGKIQDQAVNEQANIIYTLCSVRLQSPFHIPLTSRFTYSPLSCRPGPVLNYRLARLIIDEQETTPGSPFPVIVRGAQDVVNDHHIPASIRPLETRRHHQSHRLHVRSTVNRQLDVTIFTGIKCLSVTYSWRI